MDSSWLRSLLVAAIGFLLNWYGYNGATKQDHTGPAEFTLLIIKPDGFKLGIRDVLYDRLENELGLTLKQEKVVEVASLDVLHRHFVKHRLRDFFAPLIRFMRSGPIAVSVWEGKSGTVAAVRQMCGASDPARAGKSTIRGQYGKSVRENVVHSSDTIESAQREISIWFP